MIKRGLFAPGAVAMCLQPTGTPSLAGLNDDEKRATAALAILGIAALVCNKHHYRDS
ncbi:hypothetical protein [Paracoccus sp. (in: a-proteobacteria)]|uniref:hypothetical protein n=1 Tax=Paracoccus sp. TaxID=267 RepID=UPI0035AE0090